MFHLLLLALAAALAPSGAALAAPRATCSFYPAQNSVATGGSTTLTWTTTNAKAVVLNGQVRPARGTLLVSPAATTRYTLTAVNRINRTTTCRTQVAVLPTTIRTAFWTGNHGEDTGEEQAIWFRNNVINVTPTTKRPQFSNTMGFTAQPLLATDIANAGILGMTGIDGGFSSGYSQARYPEDGTWSITNHPQWIPGMKVRADQAASLGQKYVMVDEPTAPCYGYTSDDVNNGNAAEKACMVRFWNAVGDYWRATVPGGKFGMCMQVGYGKFRELTLMQAGLRLDYVCFEGYLSSQTYHDEFDAIHAAFPDVELIGLQYGTAALCQLFDTFNTPANVTNPPDYPITVGYWDVNGFHGFMGPAIQVNWLQVAQEHAQTGQRQFCKEPFANSIGGPNTNAWQSADIVLETYNAATTYYPNAGINLTLCEIKVISYPNNFGLRVHMPSADAMGVETMPWTTVPCAGPNSIWPGLPNPHSADGTPIKMTVGPGQTCRDNGNYSCALHMRATNNLGRTGYWRMAYSINHPGLPNYNPSP